MQSSNGPPGIWSVMVVLCGGLFCGCAELNLAAPAHSPLRTPSMSSNSVVLETCVIRLSPDELAAISDLWREVDEQRIPATIRRRLEANGLRAGVCSIDLPEHVARLIDEHSTGNPGPEVVQLAPDFTLPAVESWHRQLRADVETDLFESERAETAQLLSIEEDGTLAGESLDQARFLLRVGLRELPDSRAELSMVPVIQHGQPTPKFVARDNLIMSEHGQSERVLENLRCTVGLSPGETVILAGDPLKRKSVGGYLLREEDGHQVVQRLFLIRLAQAQMDASFDYDVAQVEPEGAAEDDQPSDNESDPAVP
jgi:hypothetical protein